jgi:hypothetical protein
LRLNARSIPFTNKQLEPIRSKDSREAFDLFCVLIVTDVIRCRRIRFPQCIEVVVLSQSVRLNHRGGKHSLTALLRSVTWSFVGFRDVGVHPGFSGNMIGREHHGRRGF